MKVVHVSCHPGKILIGSKDGDEAELWDMVYLVLRYWGAAWRPFLIDKASA